MLLGAVVPLEGAAAATQENEEQYARQDHQAYSHHSAPDYGSWYRRVPSGALGCRVVREVWVGKDRWKGVCQCSGGRRCKCAGAIFFFFFPKQKKGDVRETRTEKQKGKEGSPPNHIVASNVSEDSYMQFETRTDMTLTPHPYPQSNKVGKKV